MAAPSEVMGVLARPREISVLAEDETFRAKGGRIAEALELLRGDKLMLRGLMFHGFHGVKPEENKLGQKFLVDVDAWMDLQAAGKSDVLSDSVSYTDIYRIVKQELEGPPHKLLESVAEVISSTSLTKFPQISAVRVRVGKPHVAVSGPVDYLGVEITRYRSSRNNQESSSNAN